ncbi:MAG: tetratricopeptide repeat protein [Bacteroidota bacterium]
MANKIFLLILVWLTLTSQVWPQSRKNARMYHEEAEEALAKKDLKKAQESLNECLRVDPYFQDAYYTRGLVGEQLGEFDAALTDYNIYLEFHPEHTEALFSRAVLRYKQGQYELAKVDFIKLLSLPPGETSTVFYQQDVFSNSATRIFTTQGNDKAYLLNYLGLAETKLKNYKEAISVLDSAILLNPKDADQIVNRGLAKEGKGDSKGAMEDYQLALSLNPENSLARHNLGVLTSKYGLPEDSEKLLYESIERNPNLPYPHAQLAFLNFNRGDFKSALEEYNQAIQLDSTDADYLLNRGLVKEKLKDYEGSIADFTKAISLKPDFESAWFNRGNVLTKLNRLVEAIEDYSIAILYDPHYTAAYYNRALNKDKLSLGKEACEDLKKAEELGQVINTKVKSKICKGDLH